MRWNALRDLSIYLYNAIKFFLYSKLQTARDFYKTIWLWKQLSPTEQLSCNASDVYLVLTRGDDKVMSNLKDKLWYCA